MNDSIDLMEEDVPKEECGIFGLYAPEVEVAHMVSLALVALQHRGQEGCGIVTCDGTDFHSHKGIGLVSQVFNSEEKLIPLIGGFGLGHVRYATAGKSSLENTQPILLDTFHGQIAIGQNGNLTTHRSLRKKLLEKGYVLSFYTESNSL